VGPKDEAPVATGFAAKLKALFGSKPVAPEKIFTDEYFVEIAKTMEALGAKIITLKDMAGLVSPLRAASIISNSSIRLSLVGMVGCTKYTDCPRTDSKNEAANSPSENLSIFTCPNGQPNFSQIRSANA
jgi:hypothetical protein